MTGGYLVSSTSPLIERRYRVRNPPSISAGLFRALLSRSKLRRIVYAVEFLQHHAAAFPGPRVVPVPGQRAVANVVLGVAFGVPGFAVDTHVRRLTRRLGLTRSRDPVKIEAEVSRLVPPEEWTGLSLRLILHGRRVCLARAPRCPECILNDFCPSSSVGRARTVRRAARAG